MRKRILFSILSAAAVAGVRGAEWLGTGDDTLWGTEANWESSTGVPVGNIAFSSKAGDNKTVTLDGDHSFDGTFVIGAGTAEAPFVFTATPEASAAENSLMQTENAKSNLNLNNGGALKVEDGVWHFANDVILNNGANLTVTGGYLSSAYWTIVHSATLTVEGGTLSTAFRGDAEQTTDTGNGMLNLGNANGDRPVFVQKGGRVHAAGSANNADKNLALAVGNNAGAVATAMLEDGVLDVDGFSVVGQAGVGSVFTQTGGQFESLRSIMIARGANSDATMNLNGGTTTTPDWMEIACEQNTKGVLNVDGGTYTQTGNTGTKVRIGGGVGSEATVNIRSGSFRPGNAWVIFADATSAAGTVNVFGGEFVTRNDVAMGNGESSIAELNVSGGLFSVGEANQARWFNVAANASSTATVNLTGGTLAVWHLQGAGGAATVNLNGGTIKSLGVDNGNNYYLLGSADGSNAGLTVSVGENGGTIDNNGKFIHLNQVIGGSGTLAFSGLGITEALTAPTCPIKVEQGVLLVTAGTEFDGVLTIGTHGAVVVNLANAIDTATVAVGETIRLFKSASLAFESADDTLATSVFLTGPVVGYVLGTDEDGWVVATVTDVSNIGVTRKVTTFLPDNGNDTATDRHVDQNASWSNGQPANDSFDVGVFSRDATMCIWGGNNRRFGDFVIRNCRVTAKSSKDWPTIGVRHVAGVGTLAMGKVGFEGASGFDLVADETIVIECSNAYAAAGDDTWFSGKDGGLAIVNGTVIATNGCFKTANAGGVVINGELIIGDHPAKQSYLDGDLTVNGMLTVLPNVTFDLKSHLITQGPNMTLNLAGGSLKNVGANVFTNVVVSAGGDYDYAEVTVAPVAAEGTIRLDGGHLTVAPDAVETPVIFASGSLAIDAVDSGITEAGGQITLANVALAEGVTLDDVTVTVGGLDFAWDLALNADGQIVATARDATGPSRWIGGSEGYWKDAGNWSRGVPSATLPAQFDSDVLCWIDANKTVSNITVNATVTFKKTKDHPQFLVNEITGTGTVGLYHVGLKGNGAPNQIASSVTLQFVSTDTDGADSWIENLNVYAPITGNGYARIYDGTKFYGDNTAFTGHFRKDDNDTRFMTPESGLPNASRVEIYGTLWLWFAEGEIMFPSLNMTSFGNCGINLPSGARDGSGISLVLGNNDGDVNFWMDNRNKKTYQTYTQNGSGWIEGCEKFTVKKVGSGTFFNNMTAKYNMVCAGGKTTFTSDDDSVVTTVKSGATIAAEVNRTIGSTTFEDGAKVALNTNAVITVTGDVDVSGVKVSVDDELASFFAARNEATISPTLYTVLTATGTVSGSPAEDQIDVLVDGKPAFGWKALIKDNQLVYARKSLKKGFFILFR